MSESVTAFYAFPYEPASVRESVQSAITRMGRQSDVVGSHVRFRTWVDLSVSGKVLTEEILESIDESEIFSCDLTHQNANVSFELGYAIGRFKRIFASLNTSIANAEINYSRVLYPLLNMGYAAYHNHESLASSVLSEEPWKDLDRTLVAKRYQDYRLLPDAPTLFYVKPPLNSDSVIAVQ